MSFEYCRQSAMQRRESTSRENAVGCRHAPPASRSNWLSWRGAATGRPNHADTITPSGDA
jgi:hypothetical protein